MKSIPKKPTDNHKAIHVVQLASGDLWAGAEVMLYNLARSLHTEPDVKVTVILLNHGTLEEKIRSCGISMYVIDESRLNALQIFQQLNQLIHDLEPNVIHTHRIKENILGSIVAKRNHIPSIRTTHGAPEHRPPLHKLPKRLILLLDRILGRYVQKNIIAVSADLAEKLEQYFPKTKIKVIENGVDIDSIRQSISQENTNLNGYRIGIAGRLVPVKRVDLFIESALYLKQHFPELAIYFHIYGDGPLHETLQAQVLSCDASDYIRFEGHCENLTRELQRLDALLMTSDHEGLPMVLLEAMSLQIPIITHAVGGIPHLLDQGKCGTLIHGHTAKAFAAAIEDLITRPEHYQHMADQALERVRLNYSAELTAKKYRLVYQSLLTHDN